MAVHHRAAAAVTAVYFEYDPSENPLSVAISSSTMLVSSLLLTGLAVVVHRDREVAPDAGGVDSRNRVIGGAAASVAFALALVVGTAVPLINHWALWLVAVTGPFEFLARRAYRRREAARRRLSEADATLDSSSGPDSRIAAGEAQTPREYVRPVPGCIQVPFLRPRTRSPVRPTSIRRRGAP